MPNSPAVMDFWCIVATCHIFVTVEGRLDIRAFDGTHSENGTLYTITLCRGTEVVYYDENPTIKGDGGPAFHGLLWPHSHDTFAYCNML